MAQKGEANPYEAIDWSIAFHSAGPSIPLVEQALAANPSDLGLLARKALLFFMVGQLDEAKALLNPLLESNPHHPDLVSVSVQIALYEKDASRADQLLSQVNHRDWNVLYLLAKATLQIEHKDPQSALKIVQDALRHFPGDLSLRRVECQYLSLSHHPGALQAAETLVADHPDYWGAHMVLANAQFRKKQHIKALESARLAVASASECTIAWVVLAQYQLHFGNLDEAAFSAQTALDLNPLNYAAKMVYSNVLQKQGRKEEAAELKEDFLSHLDPVRKRMMLAVDLINNGDYAGGLRQSPEPSEASNPAEKESILNFKIMTAQAAKNSSAWNRYLDEALADGYSNDTVISAQARRLTIQGDPYAAESVLNSALKNNPSSPRLLVELAHTHATNQNIQALDAVIQNLKSKMPIAASECAMVCEALTIAKQYQSLVDFVELGVKTYPNNKFLLRQRIAAYRLNGEREHARSLLITAPTDVRKYYFEKFGRPKNKFVRKLPKSVQKFLRKLFPKL